MEKKDAKRIVWSIFAWFLAAVLCVTPLLPVSAEQQARVVRIPCGFNDLLWLDENGAPAGYCAEYLKELAQFNNWVYEYVECTWPEAVSMLEKGLIDLLYPVAYTAERDRTMDFSTLVGGYTATGLFARTDSEYSYEDFASFDGARIAVTYGSVINRNFSAFAQARGFSYTPVFLSSIKQEIKALQTDEVDMMLASAFNDIPGAALVAILDAYPFYYTVKAGNTELLDQVNRGMQQMLKNEPDIVAETIKQCLVGNNDSAMALTEEERAFFHSGQEIVVGFYRESEPLAYVQEDGSFGGIFAEIIDQLRENSGLNFQLYAIDFDENWKDLLSSGQIDFYLGATQAIIEDDPSVRSTAPLLGYDNVLITKRDRLFNPLDTPVIALTPSRAYWGDYLSMLLGSPIQIRYYPSARDCLLAVVHGEAGGTLINNLEFNYQSKNDRFAGLIQWENFRFSSQVGLASRMDVDEAMFSIVNKAVKRLSDGNTDAIINKHLNLPYSSYTWTDILYISRNVLVFVAISLLAIAFIALVLMVVKRRQTAAAEAIQQREKHQLQILAAMSQGYEAIYYVNLDQNSSEAVQRNDKLREVLGVREASSSVHQYSAALRQYLDTYVLPEGREELLPLCDPQVMIERLKENAGFSVRYRIARDVRQQDFFEMHFVDVSDNDQEHVMVLGIRCVDELVSEEQKQKLLLRDALDSANRASAAKSDFLSKMSHDIRTPMNAIIGMTAIAMTHADNPDRVRDALGKISQSSRHLLGLINEVLDMSKIESGKISLNEDAFNLSELLSSLLLMIQPQVQQHQHTLQVHIRDIQHEDVLGDSLRIQQVFLNLMSNAVKYTPNGGKITLTIHERPVSSPAVGCYEFIIEDNGIGMSKEYLEHIFEPFSRAEDLRISKIQGTGLGMAIAQNIVHMMNGSIKVESDLGKGSAFTMTIFLKLQSSVDIDASELLNLSALVVDDDADACESTCIMLREIGMVGDGCTSGREAVEMVKRSIEEATPYYAAILDWKMPGMDGVETAKAIKRLAGDDLPIIILSAYDWTDIEAEARAAGVSAFLSKPVFKSGILRLFKTLKNGESAETNESSALNAIEPDTYSGHRVLLVEDNELNREIAREILEMAGLTVEEAENGREAVDKFAVSASGYYEMIFMDIQMPVMNGYDAAMAIRSLKHPDARRIPILAMTANAFVEDIQASKAAGMNEHLAKPIDFAKLSEALKKYLS